MRLLTLCEGPGHVCYRYRVAALADALLAQGWQLENAPLASGWRARLAQFDTAAHFDVVLLQRKLLPRWQTWWLRRRARRLIYDFDDAMPFRDSFAAQGSQSWARGNRFGGLVRAADLVLVGNSYLGSLARERNPEGRIVRIPTTIDPARYRLAAHVGHSEPLRLVWIGQRSTVPYLRAAAPALAAAARTAPQLQLHVISDVFPEIEGVPIVPIRWSAAGEAPALAAADVGVSWLTDDPWSRGKCGLKVLQYMAAGLPVVANRVGVQCELVEHGVTGYLADTPQEWADAIQRLSDPLHRARLGEAGRRRVERDYSVARWAPEWAAAIVRLAGSSAGPARRGAIPAPKMQGHALGRTPSSAPT